MPLSWYACRREQYKLFNNCNTYSDRYISNVNHTTEKTHTLFREIDREV